MNTFKIDGRKSYQSFTNDQGVKITVVKQDKGVFFTDCKTDSSFNTGDTTKQTVEAMVNKFMNGEQVAEVAEVAAQAVVTLDGRKALQTFETNDGYIIDVIKSGRAYTVQVCYKGQQSDAYTPVINGSLIQAQELVNEMMVAIDDNSNDDKKMNNSQAKQVLSILFDAPTAYDQDVIAALKSITIDQLISSLSKWHGSRICIHSASGYSYTVRLYAGTFLLLISKDDQSDCVTMSHNWHGRLGNCFDALQAIE